MAKSTKDCNISEFDELMSRKDIPINSNNLLEHFVQSVTESGVWKDEN